jgi:hypothetical protein
VEGKVFGKRWGYRGTYANQVQAIAIKTLGNNWMPSLWGARVVGFAFHIYDRLPAQWQVFLDATTVLTYEGFGHEFTLIGGGNYRLSGPLYVEDYHVPFTLYLPNGRKIIFHPIDSEPSIRGRVKQIVGRNGVTEDFEYVDGKLVRVSQTVDGITAALEMSYGSEGFAVTLKNGTQVMSEVEYEFYDGTTAQGNLGDLKRVTNSVWENGDLQTTGESYYTYYKWHDWSPGSCPGLLKIRLETEGLSRLAHDGGNPVTATEEVLRNYADQVLSYDERGRVIAEVIGGGPEGERPYASYTYLFDYYERESASTEDFDSYNIWKVRTTVTKPDGSIEIAYSNFCGQMMFMIYTDSTGEERWYRGWRYNDTGGMVLAAKSSAVEGYDEANDHLFTLRAHAGLVYRYVTTFQSGIPSKITRTWVSQGERQPESNWIKLRERQYITRTGEEGFAQDVIVGEIVFQSSSGDLEPSTTMHDFAWHSGTYAISSKTTALPVITTGQNGSGTSAQRQEIFDIQGLLIWGRDERGFLTCYRYDPVTGALTQMIEDVNTSVSGLPSGKPTGWTTPSGGGLHLITDYENDVQGRPTQELGPVHPIGTENVRRASWTVYKDVQEAGNYVSYRYEGSGYAKWNAGAGHYDYTLINPVTVTRMDGAGRLTDEITAIRDSTIGRLGAGDSFGQSSWVKWRSIGYTLAGKKMWERVYVDIPPSGSGTSGVDYHETKYGYDAAGRVNRSVTPGGTITRTVYNARGWEVSTWIGTNDIGASDSNPEGSGGTNNMVKVTEKIYDMETAGGDGNVTQIRQYTGASELRTTNYGYDFRNRRISADGELDLYVSYSYDNADRLLQIDRLNTSASGTLLGRQKRKYDNQGRYYKWEIYAVNSSGTAGNALAQSLWYDPSGNLLKERTFNGQGYTKSAYDGVGRLTLQYGACGVADGTYAQAGNVSDDYVLQQTEYFYDSAGNMTFQRVRERNHDATGTGSLHGPSGTQPCARVSYAASYPDALGRILATADYGTGGGTAPTRPATIPASSDTCLVSLSHYNERGENDSNTDSLGIVTLQEYDAAGQLLKTIENYVEEP